MPPAPRSLGPWLATVACLAVASQAAAAQSQDFLFERISLSRATRADVVTSIVQDHQGFLWVGTMEGLHRYDGYEVVTYRPDSADSTSLSSSFVECLLVDRDGTLWIGTLPNPDGGGLHRYEPHTDSFTRLLYDETAPATPSGVRPLTLFEDHEGVLWIGARNGLFRYDRTAERSVHYRHDPNDPRSLSHDDVRVITENRDGVLWIGTGTPWHASEKQGGLNRFDRATESFTRYMHDPADTTSLAGNWISALFEDSRGTFWVGTWGKGLQTMQRRGPDSAVSFTRLRYDPAHSDRLSRPDSRASLDPEALLGGLWIIHEEHATGALWIGAHSEGLSRFVPRPATGQTPEPLMPGAVPGGILTHFEHDPVDPWSLSSNTVYRFLESRDGVLWVGTRRAGLNKVISARRRFHTYRLSPTDARSSNRVQTVFEDPTDSDVLWIGTSTGLFRFDRARGVAVRRYLHTLDDTTSLSHSDVRALFVDRAGTLWVGTNQGLNRFDRERETFTRYLHEPGDPSARILVLDQTRDGALWVGTEGGLVRLPPGTVEGADRSRAALTRFTGMGIDTLRDGGGTQKVKRRVTSFHQDRSGTLWVGTSYGLARLEWLPGDRDAEISASLTYIPLTTSAPHHTYKEWVGPILEDRNGRFWVGTGGRGLKLLDRATGAVTSFTSRNSDLPDDWILGMLVDARNRLWISTAQGLTRFDPNARTFHTYGHNRDLDVEPFLWGAMHDDGAGELFFGGENGILVVSPEDVLSGVASQPPEVVLTGLRLFGEPVAPGKDAPLDRPLWDTRVIRLQHDQNVFSIAFAGIHYLNPPENRHRYRLDPYDPDWRDAGADRIATYMNVPPGRYTFRVEAANPDGVWSESEASVRVRVLPPWWRAWWAYVAYTLIFAAGVFAVDRFQRRRLIRRERERARLREAEIHAEAADERARTLLQLDHLKSRFFANISHEFRTPLTLILGPLQDALAGRYGALDDRLQRQLGLVHRNGLRLLRLINQLLDLSKLESGRMHLRARRSDLIPFVRTAVFAFSSRAERRQILLDFHTEHEALDLYFDRDKLEQVLFNLLANALRFTYAHGKIRVTVSTVADGDDARAEIRVKDTGEGIPADELPYIFDRFHQVDRSSARPHEGAGIGLALARELIELHGGRIEVESERGFGTTFIISLPLGRAHLADDQIVEEPSAEEPDASSFADPWVEPLATDAPEEEEAGSSLTQASPLSPTHNPSPVLVVEDHADVRAYLREHLEPRYQVVEARDGAEALDRARRFRPALVISDVMMPNMDGLDFCRTLKADAALNHIPVILLTARADAASRLEGLDAGADAYLSKPFSADELLLRTENLIELRRLLRERFSAEVRLGPSPVSAPAQEAAFLERVRTAIEERLGNTTFGIDQLADEMGMSRRHLTRRVRALTGVAPAGYIRWMRIMRAAQLLEQRAGTVSEIAYRVGFKNADHFSTQFRQIMGVPPSRYLSE